MNASNRMMAVALATLLASGAALAQSPLAAPVNLAKAETNAGEQMSTIMHTGIAADLGTTALGLSMGFSEANPLGLALIPLKYLAKSRIDKIDDEGARREASAQFSGMQFGAAAANVCTLALANPVAAVACFAVGMAVGYDRVKSVPIAQDCVDRHMDKFQEAVNTGRVYRLNTKTCTGVFEAAPAPQLAQASAPSATLAQATLTASN